MIVGLDRARRCTRKLQSSVRTLKLPPFWWRGVACGHLVDYLMFAKHATSLGSTPLTPPSWHHGQRCSSLWVGERQGARIDYLIERPITIIEPHAPMRRGEEFAAATHHCTHARRQAPSWQSSPNTSSTPRELVAADHLPIALVRPNLACWSWTLPAGRPALLFACSPRSHRSLANAMSPTSANCVCHSAVCPR